MKKTLAQVPEARMQALIERYELLLLDAYGVLIHAEEALPGAAPLIDALNRTGKPYLILTNDASRLPETCAQKYRELGLDIDGERVITSGSAIPDYFRRHALEHAGLRCVVLGPDESVSYVERGGGIAVAADEWGTVDLVAVCDDEGYPMLETLDATVSMLFRTIEEGRRPRLLLPNPDLIYPKGQGRYGITAGSVALVIQAALQLRFPELGLTFEHLGKPCGPVFELALARGGTRNAILVGDQLQTDILGACRAGIDSALVSTGVARLDLHAPLSEAVPTFRLAHLAPG